ncbi:hypothetical protein PIB30_058904 [Stylosanthes scabra]|uniref:GPI inositol-deacylase n=1 Tax=Stylosanthes scabra TaxID=79078 RepID=A0ABU6RKP9_9FABA|nr:hypothetical protein [Stylosanthes scabra]
MSCFLVPYFTRLTPHYVLPTHLRENWSSQQQLPLPAERLQCTTSASQSTSNNYRPAVILPYGMPTVVAKVSRLDWFRNATGLVDPNYWRGTLQPRPAKDLAQGQEASISLIGHSAGGWLARLYMEEFELSQHVSLLLTLGTPHSPPPKGTPGVIDQTRGLLDYVEKNCCKAVYTPQLKYVCIAGRGSAFGEVKCNSKAEFAISEGEGVDMNPESGSSSTSTLRARIVGQGYKQVCGEAQVWGDGVVPEVSAHLDGALNICLDGVYHSPVGSDDALRPWHGSPAVLDQWIQHLLH